MSEDKYQLEPFTPEDELRVWKNIKKGVRKKERRKQQFRYGIAAAIILMLSLGGMIGYNTQIKPDIYVAENGNVDVKLEDGSEIRLFKGARLKVEKSFPADTRDVYLEGDALFKVAKSKKHPFIVHGVNYQTKVLGTVFKVMQKGGSFDVELYEGKVSVHKNGNPSETFTLKPKQTFTNYGIPAAASVIPTKEKSESVVAEPEVKKALESTKPLAITFNECRVKDAVTVVEKSYGIRVTYPHEMGMEKISLSHRNTSPEKLLETISLYLNLKLMKSNDTTYQLEK